MNPTKLFASFALAAVVASSAVAQSTAPVTGASLRGARVLELGFGYSNIKGSARDAFGATVGVNLPVATGFDVALDVNHAWLEGSSSIDTTVANLSAIAYRDFSGVRGFGVASIGHAWLPLALDDEWVWGLRVGAEYNVSERLTAIASVGYDDAFDSNSDGVFDGTVRLNYLASEKVIPFVAVSAIEGGNWATTLGLAWAF